MQKTNENGVKVLTADEGMRLTNGETFCGTVRLGSGASETGWREVTETEAEQMQVESEKDEELTDAKALSIILGGNTNA